jgi:DNA repair protein RecO (recombination protein O)
MEWRDHGVVLAVRRHGETSAIADVLTPAHGRCLGLVRCGRSRRQRPVLQPGNLVQVLWRARLEDHLGTYTVEPLHLAAGSIMDDSLRLSALTTLTALAQTLPEREPHARIYDATRIVLSAIESGETWPALLVRWEIGLLDELGFGLDLTKCAATGSPQDLIYVSPKSGRAVCRTAGAPYADKLFRLPAFLKGEAAVAPGDIIDGFALSGYFLERHVFEPRGLEMPPSRHSLVAALSERLAAGLALP